MTDLGQLTDEQTVAAVKLFYEKTPKDLWQDGRKPNAERIRQVTANLLQVAPNETKPLLEAAMSDDASALAMKAKFGRLVLARAKEIPVLEPYVSGAVEIVAKQHMGIDPITGAFILAMLLAVPSFRGRHFEIEPGTGFARVLTALDLKNVLLELPAIIKALPKALMEELFGG